MLVSTGTLVRWLQAGSFAAVCLAGPAAALADAPSAEANVEQRRAAAKGKYQQGADAYTAGRFKDAVDFFLAADQLAPSAPLSFNIARAYEKLGDDAGALRWYRDYLRRTPNAANSGDVQALIVGLAHALQKKGIQQLTIITSPAGATVIVDDQPLGVSPWTGELAPGAHHVLLSLRGYADAQRELNLLADQPLDETVRLEQQSRAPEQPTVVVGATAPPQPPQETPSTGKKLGILPYITLGAGGAALGTALTFELLRRGAESDAKATHVQLEYEQHLSAEQSRQTTARIFAGVGGALLAAGGVMLLLDRSGPAHTTNAGLWCLPGACAVTARGTF